MLNFILGILVAIIIGLAGSVLYPNFTAVAWLKNQIPTIQAIGSLAIALSAIVAFLLYRKTVKRHSDEDDFKASSVFLDESIRLLERAYEIFTDNGKNISPPKNSRLSWFTTARMLIRFNNMKKNISASAHVEIMQEHEEYWRFVFYKLLDANKGNFDIKYFQPGDDRYGAENVARKSIAVILHFAKWNGPDVLDAVDDKELFAKNIIPMDQFGIEEYIEQYEQYWQDVMKIKQENENKF